VSDIPTRTRPCRLSTCTCSAGRFRHNRRLPGPRRDNSPTHSRGRCTLIARPTGTLLRTSCTRFCHHNTDIGRCGTQHHSSSSRPSQRSCRHYSPPLPSALDNADKSFCRRRPRDNRCTTLGCCCYYNNSDEDTSGSLWRSIVRRCPKLGSRHRNYCRLGLGGGVGEVLLLPGRAVGGRTCCWGRLWGVVFHFSLCPRDWWGGIKNPVQRSNRSC
jgi:hypothetical protein